MYYCRHLGDCTLLIKKWIKVFIHSDFVLWKKQTSNVPEKKLYFAIKIIGCDWKMKNVLEFNDYRCWIDHIEIIGKIYWYV